MKKPTWLILLFVTVPFGWVLSDVPHGFRYTQTDLSIAASVPPALIYVENSQGQRAGADFSAPVSDNGTQGNGVDSGLTEIPLSHILQLNNPVFDGTDYAPSPNTYWNIEIYDSAPQTYTINLKGLAAAIETVSINLIYRGKGVKSSKVAINILISANQIRQISLSVDPNVKTISTMPIVGNGDLLNDVKTACQLGQITSSRVCKHLEDKAEQIQDALDHHRVEEAKGLILSFLYSLGDSRPEGCQDEDDHGFIQAQTLAILIQDAKALLASLPEHHRGDK
jgi:hypothetical protein